jgi:L-2,4-diaminobutyrate decarboxylase
MESIENLFDPETFRTEGHALVDSLADYLKAATAGDAMPVLPYLTPEEMMLRWPGVFPEHGEATLNGIFKRVISEANHLHHPQHTGHQVAAPLPGAALCDLLAAFLNNGMAVYEHGPSGTAMELQLVKWMGRALGLGEDTDGVFTSGGSVGNLTALLAARQTTRIKDKLPENAPEVVLATDQTHYSVKRALRIMGCGDDGVTAVPHDSQLRMCADALEATYHDALARGYRVIAVIGNACCTPTGAYDPLESIADFCQSHGLWFHADGAHGAAACLSEKYSHLLKGVERADSVVWDAHKMLLMPTLCTAVVFRQSVHACAAFEQEASYLFDRKKQEEWFNLGHRTVECTKRMMALKLYASLMCYGTAVFGEHVTRCFDLAYRFGELIRGSEDFELGAEPESNIVCFRYVPEEATDLDALQTALRQHILQGEEFYLVQTNLPHGRFMRTALMNPFTRDHHLEHLLESIRASYLALY